MAQRKTISGDVISSHNVFSGVSSVSSGGFQLRTSSDSFDALKLTDTTQTLGKRLRVNQVGAIGDGIYVTTPNQKDLFKVFHNDAGKTTLLLQNPTGSTPKLKIDLNAATAEFNGIDLSCQDISCQDLQATTVNGVAIGASTNTAVATAALAAAQSAIEYHFTNTTQVWAGAQFVNEGAEQIQQWSTQHSANLNTTLAGVSGLTNDAKSITGKWVKDRLDDRISDLNLDTASTHAVGTGDANVILGNDSRLTNPRKWNGALASGAPTQALALSALGLASVAADVTAAELAIAAAALVAANVQSTVNGFGSAVNKNYTTSVHATHDLVTAMAVQNVLNAGIVDIVCHFNGTTDGSCFITFARNNNNSAQGIFIDGYLQWHAGSHKLTTLNIRVNGSDRHSSDDRLKHNEEVIPDALSIISKLKPKTYIKTAALYAEDHHFASEELGSDGLPNEDSRFEAGFIAQDIWEDIPEFRSKVVFEPEDDEETFSVNYTSFHAYTVKGIQELNEKLESLILKVSTLEVANIKLNKVLSALG